MSLEENYSTKNHRTKTTKVKTIKEKQYSKNNTEIVNVTSKERKAQKKVLKKESNEEASADSNKEYIIEKYTTVEKVGTAKLEPRVVESEIHHKHISTKKSISGAEKQKYNPEAMYEEYIEDLGGNTESENCKQEEHYAEGHEIISEKVIGYHAISQPEEVEVIFRDGVPMVNGEEVMNQYSCKMCGNENLGQYAVNFETTEDDRNPFSNSAKEEYYKKVTSKSYVQGGANNVTNNNELRVQGNSLNVLSHKIHGTEEEEEETSKKNKGGNLIGQNMESMQIVGGEKPELTVECLEEMQIHQEKIAEPIELLVPLPPNDIDYVCGLEVINSKKKTEPGELYQDSRDSWKIDPIKRKILLCPENIDVLNIDRAYEYGRPPNVKENVKSFGVVKEQQKLRSYSVEKSDLTYGKSQKEKEPLYLENTVFHVIGDNKIFNKSNKPIKAVKMDVEGNPRNWVTEPEKNSKVNLEGKNKENWNEIDNISNEQNLHFDKNKVNDVYDVENFAMKIDNNYKRFKGNFAMCKNNLNINQNQQKKIVQRTRRDWNQHNIPTRARTISLDRVVRLQNNPIIKKEIIVETEQKVDWNQYNLPEMDTMININGGRSQTVFDITKEDSVDIEQEPEDIIFNDDYNIVPEAATRRVRAVIEKLPKGQEEESASEQIDVLNDIRLYENNGMYNEVLRTRYDTTTGNQRVIIRDITGAQRQQAEKEFLLKVKRDNEQLRANMNYYPTNYRVVNKVHERNYNNLADGRTVISQIQTQTVTNPSYVTYSQVPTATGIQIQESNLINPAQAQGRTVVTEIHETQPVNIVDIKNQADGRIVGYSQLQTTKTVTSPALNLQGSDLNINKTQTETANLNNLATAVDDGHNLALSHVQTVTNPVIIQHPVEGATTVEYTQIQQSQPATGSFNILNGSLNEEHAMGLVQSQNSQAGATFTLHNGSLNNLAEDDHAAMTLSQIQQTQTLTNSFNSQQAQAQAQTNLNNLAGLSLSQSQTQTLKNPAMAATGSNIQKSYTSYASNEKLDIVRSYAPREVIHASYRSSSINNNESLNNQNSQTQNQLNDDMAKYDEIIKSQVKQMNEQYIKNNTDSNVIIKDPIIMPPIRTEVGNVKKSEVVDAASAAVQDNSNVLSSDQAAVMNMDTNNEYQIDNQQNQIDAAEIEIPQNYINADVNLNEEVKETFSGRDETENNNYAQYMEEDVQPEERIQMDENNNANVMYQYQQQEGPEQYQEEHYEYQEYQDEVNEGPQDSKKM